MLEIEIVKKLDLSFKTNPEMLSINGNRFNATEFVRGLENKDPYHIATLMLREHFLSITKLPAQEAGTLALEAQPALVQYVKSKLVVTHRKTEPLIPIEASDANCSGHR